MDEKLLIKKLINKFFREEFNKALLVADNLKEIVSRVKEKYKLADIELTDALSSIVKNGLLNHLVSNAKTRSMKAFCNALRKYSKNEISEEKLYGTAKKSIGRSIGTNTRNAYQSWLLLSLLDLVNRRLIIEHYDWDIGKIEFTYIDELPIESRKISLRSGRGYEGIYPNFVIEVLGKTFSVFYEGPGIIRWRGKWRNEMINNIWKKYKIPRPDIMIYYGKFDNIYSPTSKPFPILKPDIIIESKEEENWYKKYRKKEGVNELEIVKEYMMDYKPKKFYLVSWEKTREDVCEELRNYGIICINEVNFDENKLGGVVEVFEQFT
jgi:hypothetical protein